MARVRVTRAIRARARGVGVDAMAALPMGYPCSPARGVGGMGYSPAGHVLRGPSPARCLTLRRRRAYPAALLEDSRRTNHREGAGKMSEQNTPAGSDGSAGSNSEDYVVPKILERGIMKQRRALFARYHAEGMPLMDAYKAAGYKGSSSQVPYKIARSPEFQRLYRRYLNSRAYAFPATDQNYLQRQLLRMAGIDKNGRRYDVRHMIDQKNNRPKPMAQWPRAAKGLVKSFEYEVRTWFDKNLETEVTEEKTKFILHDPKAILEGLLAPINKTLAMGAAEEAARRAQGDAEQSAQRFVDAIKAMGEANGIFEMPPADEVPRAAH